MADKLYKLSNDDLEKMKKIELEILDEFVRICDKYNIKYILAFGTCLGAVRHDGFIPWDDDIDVGVLREDYNKLVKICKKELNEKYYFQSYETDNLSIPFAKIRRKDSVYLAPNSEVSEDASGIWIDIFPYDFYTDNKFLQKIGYYRVLFYQFISAIKHGQKIYAGTFGKKLISYIFYFLSIFYSKKYIDNKLIKIKTKYKKSDIVTSYCENDIVPTTMFTERVLHKFENKEYYIPKDYDLYLKANYGDYMKLPPEDKRTTFHACVSFKLPKE